LKNNYRQIFIKILCLNYSWTPIIGDSASNGATGTPLQQRIIYDSFEDCWFAKHCTISIFEMSRQSDFQKL